MGDKQAARKSYQDFFALWKEADPDHTHPPCRQNGVCKAEVDSRHDACLGHRPTGRS